MEKELQGHLASRLPYYSELDQAQKQRVQALLQTEALQEVGTLMKTT